MSANVGGEGVEVNLTPMLDLVLQLIMFFLITVNFVRVDQFDDTINLPTVSSAVPIDNTAEEWIFLNLDRTGKLGGALASQASQLDTAGKIELYLKREKDRLEQIARAKGRQGEIKIVIILRSDENCTYRDVWKVLDSCQRAGFKHWQLRVKTKGGSAPKAEA